MAHKKVTDIKEVDKSKQLDSALGQLKDSSAQAQSCAWERRDMRRFLPFQLDH